MHLFTNQAPETPVTLKVATYRKSAEPGKDFYGLYRQIRFATGETGKLPTLVILDDDIREGDETLGFRVWDLRNAIDEDIPQGIVIEDNDWLAHFPGAFRLKTNRYRRCAVN